MNVTIYHNPRCSKSRQTLALLEERGISPAVVEYLKEPPTEAQLRQVLGKLGVRPAISCARARRYTGSVASGMNT